VRRDEGFVTVAVVGLAAVLVAVSALLATLGAVAVARHRAASAADLAALAAAGHVLDGTACEAAREVARAAGAELTDCRPEGTTVLVVAAVRVGALGTARARARAGPGSGN
jgi:secretion/DNA translocation related TadE-like protein